MGDAAGSDGWRGAEPLTLWLPWRCCWLSLCFCSCPVSSPGTTKSSPGMTETGVGGVGAKADMMVAGQGGQLVVCVVSDLAPSSGHAVWISGGNGSTLQSFTYGTSQEDGGTVCTVSLLPNDPPAEGDLACHVGPNTTSPAHSSSPIHVTGTAPQPPFLPVLLAPHSLIVAIRVVLLKVALSDALLTSILLSPSFGLKDSGGWRGALPPKMLEGETLCSLGGCKEGGGGTLCGWGREKGCHVFVGGRDPELSGGVGKDPKLPGGRERTPNYLGEGKGPRITWGVGRGPRITWGLGGNPGLPGVGKGPWITWGVGRGPWIAWGVGKGPQIT
uniref:Ig-like domain-containing protein n=1 Tax=Buteo japonicus TaxID=224669 RepID=A0A8C0B5D7_9AVES